MAERLTSRAEKHSDADMSELEALQTDARKAANIVGYERFPASKKCRGIKELC